MGAQDRAAAIAFMGLVWVGFLGRSPDEIAAHAPGTRAAALQYVLVTSGRLFLVALAIRIVILCFDTMTPLQFIGRTSAPLPVKRLLVLTLSLIDTMLHASTGRAPR